MYIATCLTCDGIFHGGFKANLLENVTVNELFLDSVNIWWTSKQDYTVPPFSDSRQRHPVSCEYHWNRITAVHR